MYTYISVCHRCQHTQVDQSKSGIGNAKKMSVFSYKHTLPKPATSRIMHSLILFEAFGRAANCGAESRNMPDEATAQNKCGPFCLANVSNTSQLNLAFLAPTYCDRKCLS